MINGLDIPYKQIANGLKLNGIWVKFTWNYYSKRKGM